MKLVWVFSVTLLVCFSGAQSQSDSTLPTDQESLDKVKEILDKFLPPETVDGILTNASNLSPEELAADLEIIVLKVLDDILVQQGSSLAKCEAAIVNSNGDIALAVKNINGQLKSNVFVLSGNSLTLNYDKTIGILSSYIKSQLRSALHLSTLKYLAFSKAFDIKLRQLKPTLKPILDQIVIPLDSLVGGEKIAKRSILNLGENLLGNLVRQLRLTVANVLVSIQSLIDDSFRQIEVLVSELITENQAFGLIGGLISTVFNRVVPEIVFALESGRVLVHNVLGEFITILSS